MVAMGRIHGTSRIVGAAGRSGVRSFAGGSLRRERSPRPPAAWYGCVLSVLASGLTAAIALRIAEALQAPGLGGFPPIP
jgi:hypothetical protein